MTLSVEDRDTAIEVANQLLVKVAESFSSGPLAELAWRLAHETKDLRSSDTIQRLERERMGRVAA